MIQIVVALIGLAGTITAAFIGRSSRVANPREPAPADAPRTRAVWIGAASLVLWLIPITAYIALPFGFYIALRDRGAKRGTTAAVAMCVIALVLALLNSALGAYQGAHGTGWWQ